MSFSCFFLGWLCRELVFRHQPIVLTLNNLPSIERVQTVLRVEPDGLLCPCWRDSKTQKAWNRNMFNQYASEWDFMYEDEK